MRVTSSMSHSKAGGRKVTKEAKNKDGMLGESMSCKSRANMARGQINGMADSVAGRVACSTAGSQADDKAGKKSVGKPTNEKAGKT